MKNVITIRKETYVSLNRYTARGSNGSRLYRCKNKYKYKDSIYSGDEYVVCGFINGKFVDINCKDYRSAKQLFMAMQ